MIPQITKRIVVRGIFFMGNVKILTDNKRIVRDFFNDELTYVAFDTETTGLSRTNDHLIEIGAVKFNRHGIIGSPFDMLIKPPVEIPFFITGLTGIDDYMVSRSPCAAEAIKSFLDFVEGPDTVLVAHNAPFDVQFMNAELERAGQHPLKNPVIDTLRMARAFHPDYTGTEEGPYKLQSLAKRYGINVISAHRANDDARVCMEIFIHLAEEKLTAGNIQSLATQALFCD